MTAVMVDDEKAFGRRVAFHRKRRGYSQAEFAALLDRSEAWLSQVERGVRRIDRMSVLERLAAELGVPLAELAPESRVVSAGSQRPEAAKALTLVMASSDALHAVLAAAEPVAIDRLTAGADRAWDCVHRARYDDLAALIVELVPDLELAARRTKGADLRRVCAARARTYHAAAAALSKLGEHGAAWVAVDRAMSSAERAGDPLLMAEGAFRLSIVFQSARRFDLVERAALTAIRALESLVVTGDSAAISLHGALNLQLAVAAARTNDGDAAYDYLAEARRAADAVGVDRNDYDTEFGPSNVLFHEVAVAVELGDAGHALRTAAKADMSRLSPERRARLLIDIARAHAQRRRLPAVVTALNQAVDIAPQQVETHGLARELMLDLLRGDGGADPDLQRLAVRLNLRS